MTSVFLFSDADTIWRLVQRQLRFLLYSATALFYVHPSAVAFLFGKEFQSSTVIAGKCAYEMRSMLG